MKAINLIKDNIKNLPHVKTQEIESIKYQIRQTEYEIQYHQNSIDNYNINIDHLKDEENECKMKVYEKKLENNKIEYLYELVSKKELKLKIENETLE